MNTEHVISERLLVLLTEHSRKHQNTPPFAPTVIRFRPDGTVALMNRQDKGWAEFGYEYDSLWAVAEQWRLVFLNFGVDQYSRFVRVAPGRGGEWAPDRVEG